MDTVSSWNKMNICTQLANVGSEVNRAIMWKNKGNDKRKEGFCNKAIEFLNIIKKDPDNKYRQDELDFCITELQDYFLGENYYNTDDKKLMKYYDAFIGYRS